MSMSFMASVSSPTPVTFEFHKKGRAARCLFMVTFFMVKNGAKSGAFLKNIA